jgi:hypothetical protein
MKKNNENDDKPGTRASQSTRPSSKANKNTGSFTRDEKSKDDKGKEKEKELKSRYSESSKRKYDITVALSPAVSKKRKFTEQNSKSKKKPIIPDFKTEQPKSSTKSKSKLPKFENQSIESDSQ